MSIIFLRKITEFIRDNDYVGANAQQNARRARGPNIRNFRFVRTVGQIQKSVNPPNPRGTTGNFHRGAQLNLVNESVAASERDL
jgi:hypothetical protein